jgi:hypothetical protein
MGRAILYLPSSILGSTAFQSPSANAAVTSGAGDNNGYQTSPGNAYADDNLYAVDTNSGTASGISSGDTG